MNTYKSKSGIKQPLKKNRITAKATEGFILAEEPVGAIDFSNHHCIFGEKLKTAHAGNKRPHIDEPTRGNEALLDSLRLASLLTYKSPNPIIGINSDTSIAYVNSALEKLTGYSSDELIGTKIPYPWWTKSNLKKTRRNFEKALNNDINKIEELFTKKNGELFWVEITTTIIKNKRQPQYYLLNWVDITEQKQAEDELKETADYLNNLLDHANAPIIVWDPEFKITRFNHAFEKLTQKSASEVIGKSLEFLLPKKSTKRAMAHISHAASGERWETVEIPIQRVNGDTRTVLWNSANIYETDGISLKATIAQGTDITERKLAEEALKDTTSNLKERLKELNCFHEVSLLKDAPNKTLNEFLQDVISLLPPAGQHPELTCARITFEGNEFKTDNFKQSPYKLTANIKVSDKTTGAVEVFHLGQKSKIDKYPFLEEEITLVDAIAREIGKHVTRVRAEEKLKNTHELLITEQVAIRGKNIAMKEVLSQIEKDKKNMASQIQVNIDRIIKPILKRLNDKVGPAEKNEILLIQSIMERVTIPFVSKLETMYGKLTPRETEICSMIKGGLSSKEIASLLNTSWETVRNQRKMIRKKLGITGEKTSLTSLLKTI